MKILLVDDEKILSKTIGRSLESHGYIVDIVNSLQEFLDKKSDTYHLFIIDLSLGDGNGYDIIQYLRREKNNSNPIIIVSGHDTPEHKIKGLDIGADDYLTKPVYPDELLARIRTILRREKKTGTTSRIHYKEVVFDMETREVVVGGIPIDFTKKEKQIIEFFLLHKGKLTTKRELIKALWKDEKEGYVTDNTINVTIYKVRKKLGNNFNLQTIIGEGYILND